MTRLSQNPKYKNRADLKKDLLRFALGWCSAWCRGDVLLCTDVLDMVCDEITRNNQEIEMKDLSTVPTYLTTRQVSDLLQISKESVNRYIRRGQITALQIGGIYRITETEVLRILGDGIPSAPAPKKTKRRKKNGTKGSSGSKA